MMAAARELEKPVHVEHITDEALMAEFQNGSARAFERLFTRHKKPVFSFLVRHVGRASIAEELFQELFLRVIKAAPVYRPEARFTTWLYTIARNLCIDQARRQKARPADTSDETGFGEPAWSDRAGTGASAPDRQLVAGELQAELTRAIDTLLPEQREVFLMREFLNLRFKEIAAIVGVGENTVKSRMRYALEHLRQVLGEGGNERGVHA